MPSIFKSNKDSKRIKKEIVWHNVGAPSNEKPGSLESYIQFELAPQYNGLVQYYDNYNLCLRILVDSNSVDESYFRNMDRALKSHCPSLIGRYEIVKI